MTEINLADGGGVIVALSRAEVYGSAGASGPFDQKIRLFAQTDPDADTLSAADRAKATEILTGTLYVVDETLTADGETAVQAQLKALQDQPSDTEASIELAAYKAAVDIHRADIVKILEDTEYVVDGSLTSAGEILVIEKLQALRDRFPGESISIGFASYGVLLDAYNSSSGMHGSDFIDKAVNIHGIYQARISEMQTAQANRAKQAELESQLSALLDDLDISQEQLVQAAIDAGLQVYLRGTDVPINEYLDAIADDKIQSLSLLVQLAAEHTEMQFQQQLELLKQSYPAEFAKWEIALLPTGHTIDSLSRQLELELLTVEAVGKVVADAVAEYEQQQAQRQAELRTEVQTFLNTVPETQRNTWHDALVRLDRDLAAYLMKHRAEGRMLNPETINALISELPAVKPAKHEKYSVREPLQENEVYRLNNSPTLRQDIINMMGKIRQEIIYNFELRGEEDELLGRFYVAWHGNGSGTLYFDKENNVLPADFHFILHYLPLEIPLETGSVVDLGELLDAKNSAGEYLVPYLHFAKGQEMPRLPTNREVQELDLETLLPAEPFEDLNDVLIFLNLAVNTAFTSPLLRSKAFRERFEPVMTGILADADSIRAKEIRDWLAEALTLKIKLGTDQQSRHPEENQRLEARLKELGAGLTYLVYEFVDAYLDSLPKTYEIYSSVPLPAPRYIGYDIRPEDDQTQVDTAQNPDSSPANDSQNGITDSLDAAGSQLSEQLATQYQRAGQRDQLFDWSDNATHPGYLQIKTGVEPVEQSPGVIKFGPDLSQIFANQPLLPGQLSEVGGGDKDFFSKPEYIPSTFIPRLTPDTTALSAKYDQLPAYIKAELSLSQFQQQAMSPADIVNHYEQFIGLEKSVRDGFTFEQFLGFDPEIISTLKRNSAVAKKQHAEINALNAKAEQAGAQVNEAEQRTAQIKQITAQLQQQTQQRIQSMPDFSVRQREGSTQDSVAAGAIKTLPKIQGSVEAGVNVQGRFNLNAVKIPRIPITDNTTGPALAKYPGAPDIPVYVYAPASDHSNKMVLNIVADQPGKGLVLMPVSTLQIPVAAGAAPTYFDGTSGGWKNLPQITQAQHQMLEGLRRQTISGFMMFPAAPVPAAPAPVPAPVGVPIP